MRAIIKFTLEVDLNDVNNDLAVQTNYVNVLIDHATNKLATILNKEAFVVSIKTET